MEFNQEEYIKGFNHADLLSKHKPAILESLVLSKSENSYFLGLKDAYHQLKKDKVQNRLRQLDQNKGHEKDLEL